MIFGLRGNVFAGVLEALPSICLALRIDIDDRGTYNRESKIGSQNTANCEDNAAPACCCAAQARRGFPDRHYIEARHFISFGYHAFKHNRKSLIQSSRAGIEISSPRWTFSDLGSKNIPRDFLSQGSIAPFRIAKCRRTGRGQRQCVEQI